MYRKLLSSTSVTLTVVATATLLAHAVASHRNQRLAAEYFHRDADSLERVKQLSNEEFHRYYDETK